MKHTGTKALSWLLSLALVFSLVPGMSLSARAAGGTEVTQANVICQQYSYNDAGSYSGGYYDTPPVDITNIALADAQAFGAAVNCPTTYWVVVYAKDGDNLKWTSNGKTGEQTSTPRSLSLSAWCELYNDNVFHFGGNYDPDRDVTFYFSKGLATVGVAGVSLDKTTAQTIDVDGTVSFTATVSPDNATDKTVKWSVGGTNADAVKLYTDADCATEVGADATETLTVYAKGESAGSATVTATSNADSTKTASCAVTVNAAQTQTETLLTAITAVGSSNANSATSANVSYSTEGVATLTFSGSVSYNSSAGWGWWGYGWTATVNPAEGYTITKCIFYDDKNRTATDSEAPFEVETTEGDKTPQVNGTPILANQSKGITKIEVYGYATPASTVAVTGVSLDKATATLTVGGEESLTATVAPDNATNKAVTWASDNTSVATVDSNGKVTAVSAGTANITVTTTDGSFTATCAVTVNAAQTQTETLLTTLTFGGSSTYSETTSGVVSVTATNVASYDAQFGWLLWYEGDSLSVTAEEGYTITKCVFRQNAKNPITDTEAPFEIHSGRGYIIEDTKRAMDGVTSIEVYGYTSKAAQTITAEDVTATYGDTGKKVTATTSGNGEISYAVKSGSEDYIAVDASTGALTIKKAGTATVTVTAAGNDEYAEATKDVTVTVNKKAVTVTADNKSMTVGSTAPELTNTVTGLVGSDQAGVLDVSLVCEYDLDTPGTYTIVASGEAEQGNYTVTYQNGTLTISRRPSSGGGTPTTTTVTVPVSGDDEKVNVTVRVSGDTATVTTANVDKVLEAETVGTVTIDVSTLKQEVSEVVLPAAMVGKIADAVADEKSNADGLEVKLPVGAVTFDAEAVAAISEQANGKDLRLNLEGIGENKLNTAQKDTVRDMDVQEVLDAYMTAGGRRISDFKGGKATVTVPYELKAEQRAAGVTVWYVADNGDKTEMPSTYDGKDVKFTVEHFSNYVIAYDAERAAACPRDETCPVSAFTDTDPGAWYHDGVHYALEKGLMNGVGDNQFDPNGTASRGMIVTILYRMENEPEVAAENPFGDVVDGQWYTNAVIWAAENKIVDGYGGGKFGPNDHITREQLVTILYRYAKWKGVDVSVGEDTNILSYDDAFDVSEWAIPAMQWAVGSGAVGGRTNTTLNPKDTATRAEAATIIMRYCTEIAG